MSSSDRRRLLRIALPVLATVAIVARLGCGRPVGCRQGIR